MCGYEVLAEAHKEKCAQCDELIAVLKQVQHDIAETNDVQEDTCELIDRSKSEAA